MFSLELKEGTSRVHAELEKKLVTHIKKIASIQDYIGLLELMYGFYFPLQQKLEPYMVHQKFESHQRGRQAQNILNDIQQLHPSYQDTPPVCTQLPEINSFAASLGSLYVLEGSTLGGQIITKMISRQLNMPPDQGFSFFNAYGTNTAKMWQDFKLILDQPYSPEERKEMMLAAIASFSTFKQWIALYESRINQ